MLSADLCCNAGLHTFSLIARVWPYLRAYNELVFGSSAGPPDRGKLLDKPYAEDNTGFIGSGMRVPREELPVAQVLFAAAASAFARALTSNYCCTAAHHPAVWSFNSQPPVVHMQRAAERHVRDFQPPGWTVDACSNAAYFQYRAVDIKGVEVVQSMTYLQAKSRISYFAKVDYEGEGTYIARISKYLKVVPQDGGPVLRLSIADLYKAEYLDGYHGGLWQVKPARGPSLRDYPMAVSHIQHKVVFCDATKGNAGFALNLWRCTTYSNTYTKRDPNFE